MTRYPFDPLSPVAAGFVMLAACATTEAPAEDAEAQAREAAYQQCLHDSMAVAMAWEAIEEMCRERTEADGDPLDLRPDTK